ncbi:MAG: alcohol dehydrogenase catalytic domain-containing protein [Chloroflexi bacterium]|jgi:2-desacetyl-2-hydroxyethyl bacteriochlorophyllide A dehydrogenase|nr:alcohol dehydrogenase catalytic domain-containing protein [Chloroflexota bacterium]
MMKAALIHGPGDIRLETINIPVIQDDEILVKVHVCGICGTDVHSFKVGYPSMSTEPVIPGHEFSGEVVEVGSTVNGLSVGDRVVGTGLRDCGKCYWCENKIGFCPNPTVPGEGLDGAIAEYVVVPKPVLGVLLFNIPEGISWEEAATIEPMSVSCYAVEEARMKEEGTVVVLGAGVIGLGVLQACKAKGASKVIVSEPSGMRREMARRLGADIVLNPSEVDPVEAVMEATSGHMAGVVFECSGVPSAFMQAPLMIQPFGKIMQVGIYEKNLELHADLMKLMFQFRNATIRGCGGQRWDKALEFMQAGKIRTKDLVTHVFPLQDVRKAFDTQMKSDEAIKVLVKLV